MIGATNPHARPLRQASTDAERLLWRHLRNRQLAGHKFRRQATLGPYIVDFLCIEARLIVEADGGQHDEEGDKARTTWLESRGLRVVRFWNHDILQNINGVLEAILLALKQEEPSPNLSRKNGRGLQARHLPPLSSLRERVGVRAFFFY